MKKKFESKFDMFLSLKNYFGKNQKKLESIREIERALKKFNNNLSEMQGLKEDIAIDLKTLVQKKDNSKKALINEASPVINILKAYANDTKCKTLKKKIDFSKKKLEKTKDSKLSESCKTLWKESRRLINKTVSGETSDEKSHSILNYGLSRNMIDTLDEVNQNFNNACSVYQTAKSEKDKFEKEFESLIQKNETILKKKLDLLLSVYEFSEPELFKQYVSLRQKEKKEKTPVKKPAAANTAIPVKTPVSKVTSPVKKTPVKTVVKKVAATKTSPIAKKKPVSPTNPNKIGGENVVKS